MYLCGQCILCACFIEAAPEKLVFLLKSWQKIQCVSMYICTYKHLFGQYACIYKLLCKIGRKQYWLDNLLYVLKFIVK